MSVTTALLLAGGGCFLPIFISGQQIDRWEGALFFGYHIVVYALYLILDATEHEAPPAFSTVWWSLRYP